MINVFASSTVGFGVSGVGVGARPASQAVDLVVQYLALFTPAIPLSCTVPPYASRVLSRPGSRCGPPQPRSIRAAACMPSRPPPYCMVPSGRAC